MGRNFDDYPGFQPFRSWANTYAQDCMSLVLNFPSYVGTLYKKMSKMVEFCGKESTGSRFLLKKTNQDNYFFDLTFTDFLMGS